MQINQIKRNTARKKSIKIGRGGKRGKTSGRGNKGQGQHGSHGMRPEIRDMIKRIPKLRGRGKHGNTSIQTKPEIVNISLLEKMFISGDVVSPKILLEKKLVKQQGGKIPQVKILGNGDLNKKLSIERCLVSVSAKKKIEEACGVVVIDSK